MKKKLLNDTSWQTRTKLELEDIIMLTELCMEGNYFEYKQMYFEQLEGAAMGSPISPCFSEFLMQDLEESLIPSMLSDRSMLAYFRYMDDIFSIVKRSELPKILEKHNSYHTEIQFTFETMENFKLPFLDTMIEIKDDFHLKFSIYRKPTNTDKYLDFRSNHPTCYKLSEVDTLVNRAIKICDDETLDNELTHITKVLMMNNYPKNTDPEENRQNENVFE